MILCNEPVIGPVCMHEGILQWRGEGGREGHSLSNNHRVQGLICRGETGFSLSEGTRRNSLIRLSFFLVIKAGISQSHH